MFKFLITIQEESGKFGVFTKDIDAGILADAWPAIMAALAEMGLLNCVHSIERI